MSPSQEKTVVVVGASRGIGLEFVNQYASDPDTRVLAGARNPASSDKLTAALPQDSIFTVDVSDEASATAFAQAVKAAAPHVDTVIVNAGVLSREYDLADATKQGLMRDFETNAVGPLLVIRALADAGVLGGDQGASRVLIVSSVMGSIATVGNHPLAGKHNLFAYRTSKAATNMVGRLLNASLAPQGVEVAMVHPGYVKTDMNDHGVIDTATSVRDMRHILKMHGNIGGSFFNHEGLLLPW